jgi:hypothetical protein
MFPECTMKPLFYPRAMSSLFVALAAVSFMQCAQAAGDADAGMGAPTAEDKLLGAPDTYGAGYADPYGRVQEPAPAQGQPQRQGQAQAQPNAAAGTGQTSAEKMMDNSAQTNASFVKPGSVAYKPAARVQTKDPAAAQAAAPNALYGNTGAKAAKNKTTEIYRSPY